MSVGERIRALRKEKGIKSQEELAYLLDTARQTVSSWERDICLPEGANLIKLSKVLNTSVANIVEGADSGNKADAEPPLPKMDRYYSLNARAPKPFSISIERSEKGKTVRYDLPPDYAERVFPFVEKLWERIEKEMEGR